ncbi:D-glycero-alpha-D-manno-heptose-1,7-bisphosphate 7-phosphatase [Sphingomonas sp. HT-1]|uniref:D-glycero-alpha-D-manno-heptose-1,7-bisphosphate 7-phosphatase n=1 Tax=unclassified Sphingomonas TaxID=196159 RepID=UPI0002EF8E3E|nr:MULTISPECIES: HAD family hydrolase [unclassified Sphingomonas]KTF68922.1 hypothetical protein ATB93_11690 [Sphingomonas sp. WG]
MSATGTLRPVEPRRKAIFLDRDGTLIVERNYLSDPAAVELERGVVAGLTALQRAGWLLVMITNQSGIARGFFSEAQARRVNEEVLDQLAAQGVVLQGIYMCPHGPADECDCRKPAPGMLIAAAETFAIDLAQSVVIGDKRSDVEAAISVGALGVLVLTGHGCHDRAWAIEHGYPITETIATAARLLDPPSVDAHPQQ